MADQRSDVSPLSGADVPVGRPRASFATGPVTGSNNNNGRDVEAGGRGSEEPTTLENANLPGGATRTSSGDTAVGIHTDDDSKQGLAGASHPRKSNTSIEDEEEGNSEASLAPIRPAPSSRPTLASRGSDLIRSISRLSEKSEPRTSTPLHGVDENALFQTLSRRKTEESGEQDDADIERLLSTIFGAGRQEVSQEEKTRHVGVVFKNLTVKGQGIGASLQPTNGDILLAPFRGLWNVLTGKAFRRTPVRTLLNDFTGVAKPQEMVLVLGRPGAGCSTFLKVIGNQRNGYEDITGEVTYGGVDAETVGKKYRDEVIYAPEDDLHYATLTVRDTLRFALKTRTPDKASRKEGESRQDYVREFLRVVSKLFWIEHTLDTKVGNEIIRGVSGGEKKRVSIAEALITKASCQCWDNSTRGLDASTALEFALSLRSLTNMAKISTFVALYQAGESLFNLFDKVILIEEGRCIYYGRTEDAASYFEGLGFQRPERWTTADFLTSVTDKHERQVKEGWESRIPRNAEEFEAAYRRSEIAQRTLDDIAKFEETLEEQKAARAREMSKETKKNYTIPFYRQVLACTSRQIKIMKGDPMSLRGKWGGILFQSLIVGSLFFNLPSTAAGAFPRGGIMFFTLLFNSLLALAELTASFGSRPIIQKHRSFAFYRPAAFAIAQVVADLPQCFVQVSIWELVIYFMAHLQRTPSNFFISFLIVYILTLSMYSFFRMIGAFSTSLDVATRVTGVAIQALVVYTGYLIPPSSMHPWFSWIRWINPVQYAFEALMANEFNNLKLQCVTPYLVPSGPGIQPEHQSCALAGSKPGSTIVNGSDYIKSQFTYTRAHLWRNVGIIIGFWIFFVVMTAIGLELQKPNKGGAAVTMYLRGHAPTHVEKAMDNGNSLSDEESGEKSPADIKDAPQEQDEVNKKVAKNDTVFTWQNVTYTIPYKGGTRVLLNNVQGYVRPGRLTALMGESGAGKSTLLNTLAQRITFGKVEGTFLVDGNPLPLSFQRATGFAEQQDVHIHTATVREALRFSALLRQPKEVPTKEKYDYVEKIISLLEMEDIAGATIGMPGTGLNQEQRKRLTIGVELASKPELLMFLDEPTSGLDSGAAYNIVRFLRKLADAGQAILCTIHQPSAVLFEHFDELLLLKSGGSVVYHGPLGNDSQTMLQYFERNGAPKCPPEKNPAEYMLEAIGAGDPNAKTKDWGEVWMNSPEHGERAKEIENFIRERQSSPQKMVDDREYAMPWITQVLAVVQRSFVSFWRSPEYIIGMFMLHIFTGLFNSFTFWKLQYSTIDMQSRLFSVFMTLTIAPPLIQQLQPKFISFRNIFATREKNSKIYHWSAFVIGAILVEIPYRLLAGTLYFVCWYFPIGYPRDSFRVGYTWMILMLFELFYLGMGQTIASFSPNELLASLLVPVFFLFVVSFCGVVVPYAQIPTFWRRWMFHLTPFRYLLEGFLGVLTHNVPVRCSSKEFARFTPPSGQTCQQYMSAYIAQAGGYVQESNGLCEYCQYKSGDEFAAGFNIRYKYHWRDYGVFWAYCAFNFAATFFFTWVYLGGIAALLRRIRKAK